MKKRIILFVVLGIVALNNAVCQTTTIRNMPSCAYSSESAVGRVSSDGNHIISYHFHGSYGEFVWTDVTTNSCLKFNLQNDILIGDFERMGDTVFFCGFDTINSYVGYFTESVFTSGSGNVFYAKVPEVSILDKMEVYYDPNTQNPVVAAVGHDPVDTNLFIKTAIFVFEFAGGNVTYNYRDMSRYWLNRIYLDVAVTKNYIVAVGIYDIVNNQIALTVIDKNNTLFIDRYIPIETAGNMNSTNYSIEYLKDDEVAISSLVEAYTIPPSFISPVHVFDAATATFVNSQTVPIIYKSAPYNEMKFFPINNTLLLLQTNDYPVLNTYNSVIYYLDPYKTTPYNALSIYDKNSFYYSLDRFTKSFFLATGELKALSHSFLIHDILSSPQFACLESDYNIISPIDSPLPNGIGIDQMLTSSNTLSHFKVTPIADTASTTCKQE